MKAKLNTDALRLFIGLAFKLWFPILVVANVFPGIQADTAVMITAAFIGTNDAFFAIFKSGTPNPGGTT